LHDIHQALHGTQSYLRQQLQTALAETRKSIQQIHAQLSALELHTDTITILAPENGIIESLNATQLGQSIAPHSVLLRLRTQVN
jgi:multidrug resistance efflux pump